MRSSKFQVSSSKLLLLVAVAALLLLLPAAAHAKDVDQANRELVLQYKADVYEAVDASVSRRIGEMKFSNEWDRISATAWMRRYAIGGHADAFDAHFADREYDEAGQVLQQLSRAADVDLRPQYVLLPRGGWVRTLRRLLVFVPYTRELYRQKVDPATFQPVKEEEQ